MMSDVYILLIFFCIGIDGRHHASILLNRNTRAFSHIRWTILSTAVLLSYCFNQYTGSVLVWMLGSLLAWQVSSSSRS
ncbi:hypothetical protein F5Y11DRAFT_341647 [Daldinia sp. FL1419]|nr:hypothetical protein F5Y11DRAFT_341647 [Daldinia sp. FL1419]